MAADKGMIFTEEPSTRRKVIQKEVGRGTNCSNNPPAVFTDELSIVIPPELCSNEDAWLSSLVNGGVSCNIAQEKPKIQRVPPMFRDIESNKKCYDPLVVSIGPFHHGKPELAPMEKFKFILARNFAKESTVSIEEIYKRVKEVASEARKCYAEGSTEGFDDKAFSRMMFLDSCFILQFMYCIVREKHDDMKMKSHDIAFVRRDFFLLENQLPFEVLKVLMSFRFQKGEGEDIIKNFINRSRPGPRAVDGCIERVKKLVTGSFWGPLEEEKVETLENEPQPVHLLELVRTHLIDVKAFPKEGCYLTGEWCSYRSAMELRTVGIHFRPGKSRRLSDIAFESTGFSSQLTLPPITIDDSTKSMLLNLVAYEASPDTPDDFGVTSYLCFMDSLIDHAEDVKELRSKGILLNFLGSDQQVADLFNEIGRDLVPNPHGFVRVKGHIQDHYKNNIKVWMAEWTHTHFRSPWAVIAFFGAVFVISLSAIQTVLAAIQTHLTAHPPQK